MLKSECMNVEDTCEKMEMWRSMLVDVSMTKTKQRDMMTEKNNGYLFTSEVVDARISKTYLCDFNINSIETDSEVTE